jgi:hypothetical protein
VRFCLQGVLVLALLCRETTEGLGRMIARELQPPALADQLDLSEVSTQLRQHHRECLFLSMHEQMLCLGHCLC